MKNFVEELRYMFFYAAVASTDNLSVLSLGCAWEKQICTKAVSDISISSKAFTLLHLFVPMRSDDHSCVENQSGELFEKSKSCWLSALLTPDPSLSGQVWGVGVLAELLVSEIYKNCWMQPPQSERSECKRGQTLFDDPKRTLFEAYWALEVQWLLWAKLELNKRKSISCCFDGGEG